MKSIRIQPLLIATALATSVATTLAQGDINTLLENDTEHGFKPTITLNQTSAERIVAVRDGNEIEQQVVLDPQRLGACVVASLVGFNFAEISPDMEVGLTVGDFTFGSTLGEAPGFDAARKTASFPYLVEIPQANPLATPRFRSVGYVTFTWTTQKLTVKMAIWDAQAAEATPIEALGDLVTEADLDPEKGGTLRFANRVVPVTVQFGSATGARDAYSGGLVRTLKRKVASVPGGGGTILDVDSATLLGRADITNPGHVADIPAIDSNGDGLISFTSVVTDLPPSTFGEPGLQPLLQFWVNDDEKIPVPADEAEPGDFTVQYAPTDAAGRTVIGVRNLPMEVDASLTGKMPAGALSVFAIDESGNYKVLSKQIVLPPSPR